MGDKKSLYQELKRIESANAEIATARESFTKRLKNYEGLAGYVSVADGVNVPVIDVSQAQREAIEAYGDNFYVGLTLEGKQTLEQATNEIHQINKGVRRFLPRRKNDEHNQRVDELDLVLGTGSIDLVSKGIFHLDNSISCASLIGSTYTLAGFFVLYASGEELGKDLFAAAILGGFGIAFGGIGGWAYRGLNGGVNEVKRLTRARYIDQKINELFRGR